MNAHDQTTRLTGILCFLLALVVVGMMSGTWFLAVAAIVLAGITFWSIPAR